MDNYALFFNRCFNKARLKNFIIWFFNKYGQKKTILLIEWLKNRGFQYATLAGISIGIDDLKIPLTKSKYIDNVEQKIKFIELNHQKGELTEIERRQQFIEEWNLLSEKLKYNVIQFFKATNIFNPIYMMAFSGARGNISQIRQLIGMRGLMSDPQGQILDFPIRSNFREGLTLIEYLISCYGARKGVVDTALRTATSGYLTRRLIDVTQQVIVSRQDCHTKRGILLTDLIDNGKTILPLGDRIIGRVLAKSIIKANPVTKKQFKIGFKNQEISLQLSRKITQVSNHVLIRSPLTCCSKNSICQLCYGWILSSGTIVSVGEAVGILAAQSIGEPGTQLTMRTFHTGGVFTGGIIDQIYAPFDGIVEYIDPFQGVLIRTLKGQIGFLTKTSGCIQISNTYNPNKFIPEKLNQSEFVELLSSTHFQTKPINKKGIRLLIKKIKKIESGFKNTLTPFHSNLIFNIPPYTILFIRQAGFVFEKNLIAELSSPSFLMTQQQEVEQDVFSSCSGQIFFENLTLIEKVKRSGSINRVTSGTGVVWVTAGSLWNLFIGGRNLLSHGDFISYDSTLQQAQILLEKFYYLNFNLSHSLNKFFNFTKNTFNKNLYKPAIADIFLNRKLSFIPFCKLTYSHFYYLAKIYNFRSFYESLKFNRSQFVSSEYSTKRIKRFQFFVNQYSFKLNFNFHQNNLANINNNVKSKFLLYLDIKIKPYGYSHTAFFHNFYTLRLIESRQKKPVISRKFFDFKNLNSFIYNYSFWINSQFFRTFAKIFKWSRYLKNKKIFLNLKLRFKFITIVEKSTLKTTKFHYSVTDTSFFTSLLVPKNFFKILTFQSSLLYFIPTQINDFYSKNSWTSRLQLILFRNNRQGFYNICVLNNWFLNSKIFKYDIKEKYQLSNKVSFFKKETKFKICDFKLTNFNNRKFAIKPILLNIKLLISSYVYKNYLILHTIQKFFIYFYNLNSVSFKFDKNLHYYFKNQYLIIGFKTQFKLNFLLNLKLIKKKTLIESNFEKPRFSEKNSSLFLQNYLNQELRFTQQQAFAGWAYICSNSFVKKVGFSIVLGQIVNDRVCFNQTNIAIDLIYNTDLCTKEKIDYCDNYKHIQNFKNRFLINTLCLNPLIIFQKIKNNRLDLPNNFGKFFLNHCFRNQSLVNNLIFNNPIISYFRFQKTVLIPKKVSNVFSFEPFRYQKNIKFLPKSEIECDNYIKILINPAYCIFLFSYFPIYQKINKKKRFLFGNLKNKNKSFLNLDNLLFYSIFKNLDLCLIQKLKLNNQQENFNILSKVFYYKTKPYFNKNYILIKFFSNFKNSEIIYTNLTKKKSNFIILNRFDLKAFSIPNAFSLVKKSTYPNLGNFIRYGERLTDQKLISESGQIIYIDSKKLIIRKAIPFLITSRSILSIYQNQVVSKGKPLFRFLYHHIKTGDIVQGIPKIEEFFEARSTREGALLATNLHTELKQLFNNFNLKLSIFKSTQKSFEIIQQLIIDKIQKVYCSQGIYIADKHLEIVVRQMTSKVQIIEGGQTGLLSGELIEFDFIRLMDQNFISEKMVYEPIILGITKTCLETESFISAASFQETTRILTKAAIQNKIDFIRGLKQNVILGNLIPAGTGFFSSIYFKSF